MLYSHALESIFGCCSLKELAALMAVCRSWQSSVLRMRPIEGRCFISSGASVEPMCASPLIRHVAHVKQPVKTTPLEAQPFNLLALRLPHLQSLDVTVQHEQPRIRAVGQPLVPGLPLVPMNIPHGQLFIFLQRHEVLPHLSLSLRFPARLRQLSLEIADRWDCPSNCLADILPSIVQLVELTDLSLGQWARGISLAPLLAMSQLRRLHIKQAYRVGNEHTQVLRQLYQLHELRPPPWMSWAELLAPGHRLQLRQIECGGGELGQIRTTSQADCAARHAASGCVAAQQRASAACTAPV